MVVNSYVIYIYTNIKLLKERHGVIPATWYEKNMLSKDSMSNVESNINNQDVDDFEGCIMDDFDKHKFGEVHGPNTKNTYGDT